MLVLSRRQGERIWIGPNICITLVDVDRGKVRIGIQAPRDMVVTRNELGRPVCNRCNNLGCDECKFGETIIAFHESKGQ